MNYASIFGRLADPTRHTAERPDYFHASFEPLEDRKLLSATKVWVNDSWTDATHPTGPLTVGDSVVNNLPGADLTSHGSISGSYGTTAFGLVSLGDGSGGFLPPTSTGGFGTIRSAINPTIVSVAGTISILEGTYTASDIVINTPLQMIGNGTSGVSQTLIIPEVASAEGGAADAEFGVGTHSGIILFSYSSTVSNLHLDGSGNTALNASAGHGYNYHQGITTLYDFQAGGNYASLHNGSLTQFQINIPGGPSGNRSIPSLDIDTVTADNTYWHGLTISAFANQSYGTTNGAAGTRINIANSKVNNVGPSGSQDVNRIGILLQNLDNSPTPGNALFDIVNNAGVGIKLDAFGFNRVIGSSNGARNQGSLAGNTVNNAVVRGIDLEFWDGSGASSLNTVNNVAGANTAVGIYVNHSTLVMTTNTVNGSLVGLQVQNTSRHADPSTTVTPFPTFAASFVLNGPGTGVAGSIGILGENSSAEPNATSFSLGLEMFASGYETGVKLDQAVASPNGEQSLVIVDRLHVDGNKTGFNLGNNVLLQGSWFSGDPVVVTGSATYDPGFTPVSNYALQVPNSNGHKVQRIQTAATAGPSSGTFTVTYNGQTTSPVAWNVTAADMQTALNALSSVAAAGGATVTGGGTGVGGTTNSWDVTFGGAGPTFFPLVMNNVNLTATNLRLIDLDAIQQTPPFPPISTINPPTPPILVSAQPNAGVIGSGGLTLAPSSHYKAQLTGTASSLQFENFNNAINWGDGQHNSPQSNPWCAGFIPTGMQGTWVGHVTQDGLGSLVIDPATSTDQGLAYAPSSLGTFDVSGFDTLEIVAKKVSGNTSDLVLVILSDVDGTSYQYPLPMRLLNTSTFSTLTVNLNSPAVAGLSGDGVFNLSAINGWGLAGDGGFTHGGVPGQVHVGLQIDNLAFTRPSGSDQLQATSVNLAGATLDGSLGLSFIPTVNSVFRIIDNTGAGAVTGTFAGLPEGAVTTLATLKFRISYTGGTGNDVILTRIADSTIVDRKLFYANSVYDGYSAIPAIAHDEAIAPDKVALLPGAGESTFANVSGYSGGINGIFIDMTTLPNHSSLVTNAKTDFVFKISGPFASNAPNTWTTLSGPNLPAVSMRFQGAATTDPSGVGPGGVLANDRVELLWPNNTIRGTFLEVIVKAGADSGLLADDVFYFGSSPGDTGFGNDPDASFVDATDEISARNNQESDLSVAHPYNTAKSNVYDVNKDDQVDATDQILARNFGNTNGELDYISIPLLGPFVPATSQATGDARAAVASALSATTTSSGSGGSWVANRLDSQASSHDSSAAYFGQLIADDSFDAGSHADAAHDGANVDDALLDALLA